MRVAVRDARLARPLTMLDGCVKCSAFSRLAMLLGVWSAKCFSEEGRGIETEEADKARGETYGYEWWGDDGELEDRTVVMHAGTLQ